MAPAGVLNAAVAMANEEHLKILKQGVKAWNAWRQKHPEINPHFDRANLHNAKLDGANLLLANFDHADLTGADLSGATLDSASFGVASLQRANLDRASLNCANLKSASLRFATLDHATLLQASLQNADLWRSSFKFATLEHANLTFANLTFANLEGAHLDFARLEHTRLTGSSLDHARLYETVFANVDFSKVNGLETVRHGGPSIVDRRTLAFESNIPPVFLRGCGLSDWEIEAAKLHAPNLTQEQITDVLYGIDRIRAHSPIQLNPLFISYSHANTSFVETLESRFDEKHIRFWRDAHDMKAGRLETQIDRAIRHNPIVLLVLSEESVESDWVEWEVSKARELEKKDKRDVLCPVALDDTWKTCSWPGPLRRQVEKYNILDFSEWKKKAAMERQFQKLIDGLGMFYPTAG